MNDSLWRGVQYITDFIGLNVFTLPVLKVALQLSRDVFKLFKSFLHQEKMLFNAPN